MAKSTKRNQKQPREETGRDAAKFNGQNPREEKSKTELNTLRAKTAQGRHFLVIVFFFTFFLPFGFFWGNLHTASTYVVLIV